MTYKRSLLQLAPRLVLIAAVFAVFLATSGSAILNADDVPPVPAARLSDAPPQSGDAHDALTDDAPIPPNWIRASEHGDTAPVTPPPVHDAPPLPPPDVVLTPHAVQTQPHAAITDAAPRHQAIPWPDHVLQARPAPAVARPEVAIPRRSVEPQLISAELLYVQIERGESDDHDYQKMVLDALKNGRPMELPAGRLRTARRFQLSGATGIPVSCRWGEQVARTSGSMSRGGQTVNSVIMENVGTIFKMTARPAAGEDAFVMECEFETSQLGPEDEGTVLSEQDGQVVRTPNINTMSLETTVKLQPDEPILLSGSNQMDGDGRTVQTVVGIVLRTIE